MPDWFIAVVSFIALSAFIGFAFMQGFGTKPDGDNPDNQYGGGPTGDGHGLYAALGMGERSFIATTDGEVAALTLPELNGQIALLKWRAEKSGKSASLRRSAPRRLVWLEQRRESLHGIKAPMRKFK
jgi:hypothetical protein